MTEDKFYSNLSTANELYHHGVKGQKWGVRRYQNADGGLSEKQKQRLSKKYKKQMIKYQKDSAKTRHQLNVKAYNQTVGEYNSKYNGLGPAKSMEKNIKLFETDYRRNYDKMLLSEMKNNKHYKKGQKLVEKYGMLKFDNLAQKNNQFVNDLEKNLKDGKTSWDLDKKKYM